MNIDEKRAIKAEELRKLNLSDLIGKRNLLEQDLTNMRFQLTTRQLDDTSRIHLIRKGIARINEIIHNREIEETKKVGAK